MRKTLFLAIMLTAVSAFSAEQTYHKEFPVSPGARFSLDSYKGFIKIRTGSTSSIIATARIYPDQGTDPALLDHVKIRERSDLRSVSIEVDFDSDSARVGGLLGDSVTWPLVDWDIVLPDDASVALETYKSEVDLQLPAGKIDIESYKGVGKIAGIRDDFSLDTYKGEFDVRIQELADFKLETYKGRVDVVVDSAADFTLHAHTRNGDLRFEGLDIPLRKERRETTASYSSGRGNHRVDLETYKGSITIRFSR